MKQLNNWKAAFAEAITQTLWLKGMITLKERNQMNEQALKRL